MPVTSSLARQNDGGGGHYIARTSQRFSTRQPQEASGTRPRVTVSEPTGQSESQLGALLLRAGALPRGAAGRRSSGAAQECGRHLPKSVAPGYFFFAFLREETTRARMAGKGTSPDPHEPRVYRGATNRGHPLSRGSYPQFHNSAARAS
ncbi:hypothetical protein MRX96_009703 [Rhipicephalus microplus]